MTLALWNRGNSFDNRRGSNEDKDYGIEHKLDIFKDSDIKENETIHNKNINNTNNDKSFNLKINIKQQIYKTDLY
jgi:hypothetical protein